MNTAMEQLFPYILTFIALWLAYSRPDMATIQRLRERVEKLENDLAVANASLVAAHAHITVLERENSGDCE